MFASKERSRWGMWIVDNIGEITYKDGLLCWSTYESIWCDTWPRADPDSDSTVKQMLKPGEARSVCKVKGKSSTLLLLQQLAKKCDQILHVKLFILSCDITSVSLPCYFKVCHMNHMNTQVLSCKLAVCYKQNNNETINLFFVTCSCCIEVS